MSARFIRCATIALTAGALLSGGTVAARDSLGMFGGWGAFRDPGVPRCYAIAMADPATAERERQPYVAIGTWPARGKRNQVHVRLSRQFPATVKPVLAIAGQRLTLSGNGTDAWSLDQRMDAAIVAAMRSARSLRISARDTRGRPFVDVYTLTGAATAMDAATLGCAGGNSAANTL